MNDKHIHIVKRKIYIPVLAFFALLGVAMVVFGAVMLSSCSKEEPAPNNNATPDRKVLLIILDGWGIGDQGIGDVIA